MSSRATTFPQKIKLATLLFVGSYLAFPAQGTCPVKPLMTGPAVVRVGQTYSVSWSNVLGEVTNASEYYTLERSADPAFSIGVDRIRTTRPAQTLPAAPPGVFILYHRAIVSSSCPAAGPAAVISNTLSIQITSDCPTPDPVGELTVSPAYPPALTTYVVSWDTSGSKAGPGGGATGQKYRIRRTSPYDTRESVSDAGSASFADSPGDYFYQVRAEADCGTPGPWTVARKVTVGSSPLAALILVSEPKPIIAVAPTQLPSTSFVVRNGGTSTLNITAVPRLDSLSVSPSSFSLGPNESRLMSVRVSILSPILVPLHTAIDVRADTATLKIPIDIGIAAAKPALPVTWSDPDVDIDPSGGGVLRSLVNAGPTSATFVSSVRQEWLLVESLDGSPWDRPLGPGETRVVRMRVDRGRRRSDSGTEVAVVSVLTAGYPDQPQNVVVMDDGPSLSIQIGARPSPAGVKTRMLYAAMPNARDALGIGRFTSDLWLTNLDVVSPIDVSLFFTPIGRDSGTLTYHFDIRLGAGETRRYRNVVGKVLGEFDSACEVEIRSSSPTLSTTALVNNRQLSLASATARRARGIPLGTTTTNGQYGFEMRPTKPGEGVSVKDQTFILSGLARDAKRRTNILLTETSGAETKVRLELFDELGRPIQRHGQDLRLEVTVPALSTTQLDASELFDTDKVYPDKALYARISFVSGFFPGLGEVIGSVVPFATVIDNVTQDASLRVGVSTSALNPLPASATSLSSRSSLATLPFHGGPAPLLFPSAHLIGAGLENGFKPLWRTRASFTNASETETRSFVLTLITKDGEVPTPRTPFLTIGPRTTQVFEDILRGAFGFTESESVYGAISIQPDRDGQNNWKDVDVQTETYTLDPSNTTSGQFSTGMEGFSYHHGYSSFQSNLGTVQIDGAESSSRFRTNLILQEVGGSTCNVAVAAYLPGSFVPIATATVVVPPFGYISKELFRGYLGLDLSELTDVRVVVRQIDGDGVFMAFASKINLATGDPANIFLRPASAGTGR